MMHCSCLRHRKYSKNLKYLPKTTRYFYKVRYLQAVVIKVKFKRVGAKLFDLLHLVTHFATQYFRNFINT